MDAAGVPIQEEEGSASPPVIDTQLDPSVYMFEWQLNGEVLLGEIGASITALQEGTYQCNSNRDTNRMYGSYRHTSGNLITTD